MIYNIFRLAANNVYPQDLEAVELASWIQGKARIPCTRVLVWDRKNVKHQKNRQGQRNDTNQGHIEVPKPIEERDFFRISDASPCNDTPARYSFWSKEPCLSTRRDNLPFLRKNMDPLLRQVVKLLYVAS